MKLRVFIALGILLLASWGSAQTPPLKPTEQQPEVAVKVETQGQQKQEATTNPLPAAPTINASYTKEKSPTDADGKNSDTEWTFFGVRARATDILLTIFNCLLVIVGVVVGGLQIRWMKKTVKSMKDTIEVMGDTAERQLRAYITVDAVERITGIFTVQGTYYKVKVHFRNTGQTPAHNVRLVGNIEILPFSPAYGFMFPFPAFPENAGVMALGRDKEHYEVIQSAKPVPQGVLDELSASNEHRLFVLGVIEYIDAFERPQTTHFCYFIDLKDSSTKGIGPYAYGNKAT